MNTYASFTFLDKKSSFLIFTFFRRDFLLNKIEFKVKKKIEMKSQETKCLHALTNIDFTNDPDRLPYTEVSGVKLLRFQQLNFKWSIKSALCPDWMIVVGGDKVEQILGYKALCEVTFNLYFPALRRVNVT